MKPQVSILRCVRKMGSVAASVSARQRYTRLPQSCGGLQLKVNEKIVTRRISRVMAEPGPSPCAYRLGAAELAEAGHRLAVEQQAG